MHLMRNGKNGKGKLLMGLFGNHVEPKNADPIKQFCLLEEQINLTSNAMRKCPIC